MAVPPTPAELIWAAFEETGHDPRHVTVNDEVYGARACSTHAVRTARVKLAPKKRKCLYELGATVIPGWRFVGLDDLGVVMVQEDASE